MKISQKGTVALEIISGSAIVAIFAVSVLQVTAFLHKQNAYQQSYIEAKAVIQRVKSAYRAKHNIAKATEGVFLNKQKYSLYCEDDQKTFSPVGKLRIFLKWKDAFTGNQNELNDTVFSIR